ncbi:MAG: hypothetical protein C5B59_18735 [Bacteroidetes bacterium]|nr:MAG: hypothetical protein C5B59_18735 [Bacteroidota bacterium]
MHATEMLVAVLVPLGGMAMIFGIVYLMKRENLAMIEKGMNPKIDRPVPYKNLKWGLLLVGAGLGLFLAYMLDRYVLKDMDNPAIYFALIAIGGGCGLIGSYRVEKKELLDRNQGQ